MRRIGAVLLSAALGLPWGPARADELEDFRRAAQAAPDDLDAQLKLATRLSWKGERAEARTIAAAIVAKAPGYTEALVLLARLEGWDGDYPAALEHLRIARLVAPSDPSAIELEQDLLLWSGKLNEAKEAVLSALQKKDSVELYYRLAQIEYERLHYLAAYQAAQAALDRDPTHLRAKALKRDISLASAELYEEGEHLAGTPFAWAQIISVTALPRSFLSLTLVEELRHRFGELNQRLGAQVDWRPTKDQTLTLFGAFGAPATQISKASVGLRFMTQILPFLDGAAQYSYDRIQLPADLHRVRLDVGVKLPAGLRAEAAYTLGVVAEGTSPHLIHGVLLRGLYEAKTWSAALHYAAGAEIFRISVLDALDSLTSHEIGAQMSFFVLEKLQLTGGFDLQLRTNDTRVYRWHLSAKGWF